MSGSGRRRGSKWDMKEDTSPENRRDLARSNNAGNSFSERESREYMSGRREFQRDDRINEESMLSWDGGRRQQSRSRSPRRSRTTSYKSKSRSRSRSPAQNNLQWEPSGHRANSKSGHSGPLCRDFTAGRCKKGDDCWFAHHTSPNHDNRRQFESRTVDNWESRHGNDGASRHHSETYSSGGRSKYRHHDSASDEFGKRETDRSYRDGGNNDWRNKRGSGEAHVNSEPICKFFAAGNCRNGKHCKFSHQREVSQFNHERRSPDVSRRREHNLEETNKGWNDDDPNWGDFRDSRKSKSGDENMTSNGNQWERNDGSVPEIKHVEKGFGEQDMAQRVSTENHYPSFPVDVTPNVINNTYPTNFPREQGISEPIVADNVGQIQPTYPIHQPVLDSNLGAFASNNQNQGLLIPHREPIVDPNQTDNSGVTLGQNSSLNEQLVQYSNLSATLVQLLEKRQQLPQLYAAITQQTASVLPPEPTKQYDPLSDSVETNLDELQHKEHELKEQEPAESDKEENGEAKENETQEALDAGPTDDVALDNDADENRKAKEAKGIRPFKFALAEFVKELLKPVWKEGKMSKEVYKNIVKKVVDKVTDTIQVAHIPRTKEKIDQYLSLSKPKLNKLTQAYLEKYYKT